jgi:hypothetical protein
MKSINGFNNSSLQGSSNISSINSIGTGVDIAKTSMSNDVQFQTSTGGTSYTIPSPVYNFNTVYNQFDCFVQKWKDPAHPEADPQYRLRCVRGLTSFENYNVDEQGFVKDEQFVYNKRIRKWNAYPTGTFEYDPDDASEVFLDDGYIKLTKNKNYKVFIWKINPTVDYWPESQSTQIAVIEEGIAADTNVMPKYNGGGSMQTYIVSKSESIENIVTADPFSGAIANFDAGELNNYIQFNTGLLDIVRATGTSTPENPHQDQYPTGEGSLSNYLGTDKIPSFLYKSTNGYFGLSVDGNTIDGVPCGENWAKGNAGGGDSVITTDLTNGYGVYFNETDTFNYWARDVLVGIDTSAYLYTPETKLNMMTGIINVNDFEIIIHNDLSADHVVYFNTSDLDIIANTQTSVTSTTIEMVSGKPVGNVGFKEFDCARKEIAYIKWVADDPEHPELGGKFDIYQINNGTINFNYKPILIDTKIVETQADAHWGILNDAWVSPQIVEIGLYWQGLGAYQEDLSSNKYKENSNNIGGFLPGSPTRSSG